MSLPATPKKQSQLPSIHSISKYAEAVSANPLESSDEIYSPSATLYYSQQQNEGWNYYNSNTPAPESVRNEIVMFSDTIPKVTSEQEYHLLEQFAYTNAEACASEENGLWTYNLDDQSSNPIFVVPDDACSKYSITQDFGVNLPEEQQPYNAYLDYLETQVIGFEVTVPVDQYTDNAYVEYLASQYEVTEPSHQPQYRTFQNTVTDNVAIESNVLTKSAETPAVKYTRARAIPKTPRIENSTKSKAGLMFDRNDDMKPIQSIKQATKQMPEKVTDGPVTQQEYKPHSLPEQRNTFDSKSASLKRKLEEDVVSSKETLMQNRNELLISTRDNNFILHRTLLEHIQIVEGKKKKRIVKNLELDELDIFFGKNSNTMTLPQCFETLRRNNVDIVKI